MKIKLTVEYDGAPFCGWQAQAQGTSIQGELQRALGVYLGSLAKRLGAPLDAPVLVTGSGRTDAGVHARGQVASFPWPEALPLDERRLLGALNGLTHHAICIRRLETADDRFDARLSPHEKCYAYRFLLRDHSGGMSRGVAWRLPRGVAILPMLEAARLFQGVHDFRAFRASDCTAKTTVRTIKRSELVRRSEEELVLLLQGCGFLKQMVRILAGTLLEVGLGRKSAADVGALLEGGPRALAGETAPPWGLCLEWVRYLERPYR